MRLLLDTQIVYWHFYEPKNLPKQVPQLMADAEVVLVSAVSIWEIAIKVGIGKMKANPRRLVQFLAAAGFSELPVFSRHTVLVAELPMHHGDPFDRLLIAQAMSEPLNLLTSDAKLRQYSDLVIYV